MAKSPHSVRDARKPGWFYIDGALITRYGPIIGAYGIAVYNVLAHKAAESSSDCAIIGYDSVAALIGIARNTVIRTLREMATAGVITIEQQTDDMGRAIGANIYTLCAITCDQKAVSLHGGVPTHGTPVPPQGTPHAVQGTGGYQQMDGGGTTTGIRHDQYHIESDSNTPSPSPPTGAVSKNGDGDDRTFLFLTNEAIGAAAEFADLPYDLMRADYDARRKDNQSKASIVRAWRQQRPTAAYHYAPASTAAPLQATRPNLPDTTVTPAEMLRHARERNGSA